MTVEVPDLSYDAWESGEPYAWGSAARGTAKWDQMDFHVDIGCGKLKKGRIGIDRFAAPGVNILADLERMETYSIAPEPNTDAPEVDGGLERMNAFGYVGEPRPFVLCYGLPFETSSVESVISHHFMEHLTGKAFTACMDEIYRILKPGGIARITVPLFPSRTAVEDPDHKTYVMAGTFETYCGTPDNHWHESFSVPYTLSRFKSLDRDISPPTPVHEMWGDSDAREIRVALEAVK